MTQPDAIGERAVIASGMSQRSEGGREATSLLAFASVILRSRRSIALCALSGVLIFGAVAMTRANLYLASGSFAARPGSHQVPGLAAQIGLTLGAVDVTHSTMLYAELARSNSILIPVAERIYTIDGPKGPISAPLATFLGIRARSPAVAAVLAAKKLADDVGVLASNRTGIVTISVTAEDPQIAQQATMNILRGIDSFSTTSRKADATSERKFVEGLVAEARLKLADADERLTQFRQRNRAYETSPQLKIEDGRLSQDVDMQQLAYSNLELSYQQARIEEVRNLSAINMVELPDVPVEPQRGEAARKTLIGLITGLLGGIVLAFARQRMEEKRLAGDPTLEEFAGTSGAARRLIERFSRSSAGS